MTHVTQRPEISRKGAKAQGSMSWSTVWVITSASEASSPSFARITKVARSQSAIHQ